MSTWARTYEWCFNDNDQEMIQNVSFALSEEEWQILVEEIKSQTCLTSIYSDLAATEEKVDINEFNDSINICLKIFEKKYEEISKKDIYKSLKA